MLIGIDGNEANVEKRVGVGEYALELLRQFKEFQISNFKFQIYLKTNQREDLPKSSDSWEYRVIGPKPLWTQAALPLDLFLHRPRPDVFFTPTHYAPRFSPVPTVITILDLSYIYFPQMFKKGDLYKLKSWSEYSIVNASKVLTISEASKDDIIKTYGVSEDKVVVTYPGIKRKGESVKGKVTMGSRRFIEKKFNIKGDYILFVGTLQPRKNIVRLIEAFSKIIPHARTTPRDISLLIVGKRGWQYEEILSAPEKYGIEEQVKFLDFVSDEDLEVLYQHARCFVLPSLYEGFGLPILEAMQFGCPVVTSNVSSLPEAGGDAALYVDPYNVDDIAKNVGLLMQDAALRASLIKKGHEQVKKFSWEKTAKETIAVLQEVARKNER